VSRGGRLRDEAEDLYPVLGQMLGGYLHEDWPIFSGTPEKAVDDAIADRTIEHRQQARRELLALLAASDDDTRLRKVLNEGLGVNVLFRKPGEARAFAEEIERKLLASVKEHFRHGRREN
jgi:hypothetical protein